MSEKMCIMQLRYPNDGRKLKRFITGLLKSGIVQDVFRTNYVKHYFLDDEKRVVKQEEKLLDLHYSTDKYDKLMAFVMKQHPWKERAVIGSKIGDSDT